MIIFCILILLCMASAATAQISPTCSIKAETRIGYHYRSIDGDCQDEETGFKGDYLNLLIDGTLAPNFSYSWKHRLNKMNADKAFFDATDWLELRYQPSPHWELSGGKQVVAIGGMEYERSPIDVYIGSEYWNQINCFLFGGSIAYLKGGHKWMFQFSESPFFQVNQRDLYSYNFMWIGRFNHVQTFYSANMLEYAPRRYINYLALGHCIQAGPIALEIDWMNRASDHQTFLLRDCSLIANLDYRCTKKLNLMAKMSYDVNRTHSVADQCVLPGTELTTVSAGMEYFPSVGSQYVRLHGLVGYTTGTNSNPDGALQHKQLRVCVGLTWRMELLKTN